MKLGFIGLGAMGAPMARNLLKAGHELAVWNRSPEKVDPLVEALARRADFPADAASGTQATILMVTNAEAVQEVLFGDKGVVQGLPAEAAVHRPRLPQRPCGEDRDGANHPERPPGVRGRAKASQKARAP